MDLIESFSIDHRYIIPGIFISRVDDIDGNKVTTYDIRVKRPNVEPAIEVSAMHSLEHIIATYLRNNKDWKNEVIYWGPMGCLTGFYLILKGNRKPEDIYDLILNSFKEVEKYNIVPGAQEENCGNYLLHNLAMAKYYAKEFASYLINNKNNNKIYEYPKTKRLVTNDGNNFYDS